MQKNINKIFTDKIQPLINFINIQIEKTGNKIFKYNSKIKFKDLFYIICRANENKQASYIKAINKARMDGLMNVKKSAIIKKRAKCNDIYFKQFNNDIIDFIFKETTCRLLATDGTIFYVEEKLKDKLPLSNNNNCCKIKCNAIYDIGTKIPIDYGLCYANDERSLLKEQLKRLRHGDTVIHDGGYYSEEMLYLYNEAKIDAIFRISDTKTNRNLFAKHHKKDFIIKKYLKEFKCYVNVRYIKYQIDNGKGRKNYYLCTTLIDSKYTTDYFIKAYHKRWDTETHFRYSKYEISLNDIKSKSIKTIKQDVYMNQFISIISSYIESLLTPFIKKPLNENTHYSKINTACCIDLTKSDIIKVMFYQKNNAKLCFTTMATVLMESVLIIEKYRNYERIRKKPRLKWSITGSSSHRPATGKRVPVKKANRGKYIPIISNG